MADEEDEVMEPTLQALIDQTTIKWIFVGGKGGVGKTTTSCSIAVQLAKVRKSVLVISTDPAHNLSDAFGQKFTKSPTKVNGFDNLFAMEVDSNPEGENPLAGLLPEVLGQESQMLQELAFSIPGIDEAMSFAEVMKLAQTMEFETIVFDTAPTGHTLRLLSFPSVLQAGLEKFSSLKARFGGLMTQMSSLFGMQADGGSPLEDRLQQMQKVIEEVNIQFRNPDLTTFVCVCIPEFLSLYETERLIQELMKHEMDSQNVVINQVLFPAPGGDCALCASRAKMQSKYIKQIDELYEDFHVVKMPLQKREIRGVPSLLAFSELLLKPSTSSDVITDAIANSTPATTTTTTTPS